MPNIYGKNKKGYYVKWGRSGKHYYYNPRKPSSRKRAVARANKQASAAYAHGYRG